MSTIILDLDQTLIQTIKPNDRELVTFYEPIVTINTGRGCDRDLYVRDHCAEFLDFCFAKYDHVILWTAASEGYVETLLPYLPTKNCTFYKIITRDLFGTSEKNVDWLVQDPNIVPEKTLFVDDIPRRIKGLPKNNVIVADKFDVRNCTDHKDQYLLNLIVVLKML